jgi:hypothetical protein
MGLKHHPRVVTNGLQVYLDAANSRSYSGSGNTWYDLLGRINFTLQNSPAFLANSAGGSIGFTAASSHWASSSNNLPQMTRFTVEVWHYYTGVNIGETVIVTEAWPGTTYSINYNLGNINAGSGLRIGYFDGGWNSTSPYSLSANNWYHISGTFDGSNLRLYINGINEVTTLNGGTPFGNGGGIYLMRRWDMDQFWGGHLSTVKIYNRALSQQEISQNYNATKKRYGL